MMEVSVVKAVATIVPTTEVQIANLMLFWVLLMGRSKPAS